MLNQQFKMNGDLHVPGSAETPLQCTGRGYVTTTLHRKAF